MIDLLLVLIGVPQDGEDETRQNTSGMHAEPIEWLFRRGVERRLLVALMTLLGTDSLVSFVIVV